MMVVRPTSRERERDRSLDRDEGDRERDRGAREPCCREGLHVQGWGRVTAIGTTEGATGSGTTTGAVAGGTGASSLCKGHRNPRWRCSQLS